LFASFQNIFVRVAEQVETLGDKVYMVAGGVPDRRADHADCVAAVALEFRTKVTQISVPDTDQLLIRIGISASYFIQFISISSGLRLHRVTLNKA